MASQIPKALDCKIVIKELKKTYDLTTLLQQEIASMPTSSSDSQVGLMFEELLRALRSSLNLLCNGEVLTNNSIQGLAEPRDADNYQEEHDLRSNYKEVHTSTPYDDGYQWRKYGRKNILNSAYPRDYYRCIYSSQYNCKAKKYVQRHCGWDPSLYKVIYIHDHTCETSIHNSQKLLGVSAKETPPPHPSPSSYQFRHEEEQAALVLCLKNIIGGSSREQEMPNGESTSVRFQPIEASNMDDMAMIDEFWPEYEMDLL